MTCAAKREASWVTDCHLQCARFTCLTVISTRPSALWWSLWNHFDFRTRLTRFIVALQNDSTKTEVLNETDQPAASTNHGIFLSHETIVKSNHRSCSFWESQPPMVLHLRHFPFRHLHKSTLHVSVSVPIGATSRLRIFVGRTSALLCRTRFRTAESSSRLWVSVDVTYLLR